MESILSKGKEESLMICLIVKHKEICFYIVEICFYIVEICFYKVETDVSQKRQGLLNHFD